MRVFALVAALVACVHAGLWALSREQTTAPNFRGQLASISYTPFDGSADPRNGAPSTAKQIRDDLRALAPYTRTIRTYSSTHGSDQIPAIANEFGLRVSLGIWLDKDAKRNTREIEVAIGLAKRHRNIESIVVGNETVYRGEQIPIENLGLRADEAEERTGLDLALHNESGYNH
jgi:exo-beta-1,3-glucanase (GH17 family)